MKNLFPVGRRSILFGVHHFLWHPITVWLAWYSLYGWPTWRETICIFIHDWGYWSSSNMDGEEGRRHPEVGARIARMLLGDEYGDLVLYHSRHYARLCDQPPSKLCWADKLSILYDPKWFYLVRAIASGEIREYRKNAVSWIPVDQPHSVWFDWIKRKFIKLAEERKAGVIPYMHSK